MTADELREHYERVVKTLTRERRMRVLVLKGQKQEAGIAEIDLALDSLAVIKDVAKLAVAEAAKQPALFDGEGTE